MSIVEKDFQCFATSLICWLIGSFFLTVSVLQFFPGYGLIFLLFCCLGGFGMLPWFDGSSSAGSSAGIVIGIIIGIILAAIVSFFVMPLN